MGQIIMKLRLSYSLLSTWQRGEIDRAVQMYFRIQAPSTPQLDDGRAIHKEISQHILTFKKLPEYMPQIPLNDPKPDYEVVVPYNDLFDLKGVYDCLDDDTVHEFKTGVMSSVDYANMDQIPFYFLIDEMTENQLQQAYLIHYNQYLKKNDFVKIWKSQRLINKAKNLVDSVGPEIYAHFQKEGLV